MKKSIEKVLAYLNAAPLPHGLAAFGTTIVTNNISNGDLGKAVINSIPIVINEFVAVWKYRDYKRLDKALSEHGFDERIAKPYLASPCGRHIARAISNKYKCREELNKLMDKYEIMPFSWPLRMIDE